MKKIALALLLPMFSVNAGMLDELKETPASKYEVGRIQLELASYMLTDKLQGERVKIKKLDGTFKFHKFSVVEQPSKLIFKMSVIGKSKYLTQGNCSKISGLTHNTLPKKKLMRDMWPNLTEQQYELLSSQFIFKTELIAKKDNEFKISC